MYLELGEKPRADTDDHGQYQHLDAGRHHVAQHLFGKEAGLVPQGERHQHEARQGGQLELNECDEELHRQYEKADDDHQPSERHHRDRSEVHKHFRETRHLADLFQNRGAGVNTDLGQPARLQKVLHAHGRAAGRQA